jgi:D-beta-D-heptose 7-phosphate kinase/D-beta-D-heptose 1-phosphate adenosyltransferase
MQHKDNIWINGCFDVLHMGHIKLFRRARQMGMRVIVGVDTDERIREAKGEGRPVNDLHNRIDFLRSIKYVDMIHSFGTDEELSKLIEDYLPRYMLIGDDYKDKEIIGSKWVKEIIYVPRYQGLSSSNIINGTYKTPYL